MALSTWLLAAAALLFVFGLWTWLRRKRGASRILLRGLGVICLLLAVLAGFSGMLLRQYHWLLDDAPAARLSLTQLGPQRYQGVLTTMDHKQPQTFELLGDEWQIDARIVRWTLPAQLSGLPPVYRFERLSGRYGDPKQDLADQRSVHDLRENWDFWQFKQQYLADLAIADARWGSAAYLPMLDGAHYDIFISPRGGLVARPADAATEKLLDAAGW